MNENFTFDGQRPDEDVIFVQKRHPWVLSKAGFVFLIIIVLIVILVVLLGLSRITSAVLIGFVLFALIYGYYLYFIYNNYLYILTNSRVIILEQGGFFSRKITEVELDKIQNITIEVKGVMGTLLNFGDVQIRTAGIDPIIALRSVENPYEVQQKIIKYSKKGEEKPANMPIIR